MFLEELIDSDSITFAIILLLLGMDFWLTKNITGKELVGLRWSFKCDEMSFRHDNLEINKWQFDTKFYTTGDEKKMDYMYFWWGMYFHGVFWGLMLLVNILTFDLDWVNFFLCKNIE